MEQLVWKFISRLDQLENVGISYDFTDRKNNYKVNFGCDVILILITSSLHSGK